MTITTLPPLDLLAEAEYGYAAVQEKVVKAKAAELEKLLGEFNVNARVVAAETGPVITMFELELAPGVKVSQIASLVQRHRPRPGRRRVRVVAPMPGKDTIGIEVPNSEKENVRIKELMQLARRQAAQDGSCRCSWARTPAARPWSSDLAPCRTC